MKINREQLANILMLLRSVVSFFRLLASMIMLLKRSIENSARFPRLNEYLQFGSKQEAPNKSDVLRNNFFCNRMNVA